MVGLSVSFTGYKCFNEIVSINNIKPINILIGKNNCGKSSVADIIEFGLSTLFRTVL